MHYNLLINKNDCKICLYNIDIPFISCNKEEVEDMLFANKIVNSEGFPNCDSIEVPINLKILTNR